MENITVYNELSKSVLKALVSKAKSDRDTATAQLKNYVMNPAGIGEHPDIIEEAYKQIENIAAANDILENLKKVFGVDIE
jgi:hypothetical protein